LKPSLYDLEKARLKEEIKKRGAKRVLIQLPEGLKPEGPRLAEAVEKAGALAIVSGDPCYGACDLGIHEAESLAADLIVHFGHSKMISTPERVPIVYIEAKSKLGLGPAVSEALDLLRPWKGIGLVTTIQHVEMIGNVKKQLIKAGKKVKVGNSGRLLQPGQVTGCNYSNANAVARDVDAFLFIGGGRFHAVGVSLATSRPTVVADPYEQRAFSIEADAQKIVRQRWASIQKAMQSKHFGVIIGLKTGQRWLEKALQARDKLVRAGKKTTLIGMREVTPEALMEFPSLDAYVNTACPRISLDASAKFQKPVLTIKESLVVSGELTWEQLLRRGLFED
jgi:2-(3-amino-3-carboxypropyl)histidine synthase